MLFQAYNPILKRISFHSTLAGTSVGAMAPGTMGAAEWLAPVRCISAPIRVQESCLVTIRFEVE